MTRRSMAVFVVALGASALFGCATVRPEQRAILSEPSMQFDTEQTDEQAMQHARENREGSSGGGTVEGGGCGCN